MKRWILIAAMALICSGVAAQTSDNRKAVRKAEREAKEQQRQALDRLYHQEAVEALAKHWFVIKTDRIVFKMGQTALVDPSMNFISLNGTNAVVQVDLDMPAVGLNGMGGITVEGTASDITLKTDKKGYTFFYMNVIGLGISAGVDITLYPGSNEASVTITPNYNSNRITLEGRLVPYNGSGVVQGAPY